MKNMKVPRSNCLPVLETWGCGDYLRDSWEQWWEWHSDTRGPTSWGQTGTRDWGPSLPGHSWSQPGTRQSVPRHGREKTWFRDLLAEWLQPLHKRVIRYLSGYITWRDNDVTEWWWSRDSDPWYLVLQWQWVTGDPASLTLSGGGERRLPGGRGMERVSRGKFNTSSRIWQSLTLPL